MPGRWKNRGEGEEREGRRLEVADASLRKIRLEAKMGLVGETNGLNSSHKFFSPRKKAMAKQFAPRCDTFPSPFHQCLFGKRQKKKKQDS